MKERIFSAALALTMVVSLFSASSMTAMSAVIPSTVVENDAGFVPSSGSVMNNIPWIKQAHTGFDGAFTSGRAHNPADDSHIQLDGDSAFFFGYYEPPYSDYLYYRESDSTEKTFSFSMYYAAWDGPSVYAQTWHSLNSVGFLINCVENSDGTISGYYFSMQQDPYSYGQSIIVIRMLSHVSLTDLYIRSDPILTAYEITQMPLVDPLHTYLYEIKSSNQAFSVTQDGVEIFALDLATATPSQIPLGYTGGNDFGFYAGYAEHYCSMLSFAEFANISIQTQTVTPSSSLRVHFVDYRTISSATPTELFTTYTATGYVGQDYTVNPPTVLDDYVYVKANAALLGSYTDTPSDITLYYVNPTLTVRYVDQDGKILDQVIKTGLSLNVTLNELAKDFAGYALQDVTSKSTVLTADAPDGVIEFKYVALIPSDTTPDVEVHTGGTVLIAR